MNSQIMRLSELGNSLNERMEVVGIKVERVRRIITTEQLMSAIRAGGTVPTRADRRRINHWEQELHRCLLEGE